MLSDLKVQLPQFTLLCELPAPSTLPSARRSPCIHQSRREPDPRNSRSNINNNYENNYIRPSIVPLMYGSLFELSETTYPQNGFRYNTIQPIFFNNRLNRAITMPLAPSSTINLTCFSDAEVYAKVYRFRDHHNVEQLRGVCQNWRIKMRARNKGELRTTVILFLLAKEQSGRNIEELMNMNVALRNYDGFQHKCNRQNHVFDGPPSDNSFVQNVAIKGTKNICRRFQ